MWAYCPLDRNYKCNTDGRVMYVKTGHIFQSPNHYVHVGRVGKPGLAGHRMVLATFRPGYHKLWMPWGDHIEGVGAGNQLSNLRYSNPTLNAINRRRRPTKIDRTRYGNYTVSTTVLKHRHSKTFDTLEAAEACVSKLGTRVFDGLEVLFKFLARGDAASPHTEYWRAAQHLERQFTSSFWRRLAGLPPGRRTKPRTLRFTRSASHADSHFCVSSSCQNRDNIVTHVIESAPQIISACHFLISLLSPLMRSK